MDVFQGDTMKLDAGDKQALPAVTPWVGGEGGAAQSQVITPRLFSLSRHGLITFLTFALCTFPPPAYLPRRMKLPRFQT